MKKILVPCDFSRPSVNAFRMALNLAQLSNGTVHLLKVIELPVINDAIIAPVMDFEEQLLTELKNRTEKEFVKITRKYNVEDVRVVTHVRFGAVAASIFEYAKSASIDIIVMGSHGSSGFMEFLIGSNAEKIVRGSSVPVLIVKDYYKGPVRNIVFPNTLLAGGNADFVSKVKALQRFFKAHLHIVWINTPLNFSSDTITSERLQSFAKNHNLNDYTIHIFNYRDEEEGILEFARFIRGDLIAMATRSRKGVAHIIHGSITENVVNHSDKPVWTYTLRNEPDYDFNVEGTLIAYES